MYGKFVPGSGTVNITVIIVIVSIVVITFTIKRKNFLLLLSESLQQQSLSKWWYLSSWNYQQRISMSMY